MQFACARLIKAATVETGAPKTHQYQLLVKVYSTGAEYRVFVTTAQAKALGFSGVRDGGLEQVVEGMWYPTQQQFGI